MSHIEHLPYGIDDPYKQAPTERFPRDPGPGEPVQIGFRAPPEADTAWLEVSAGGAQRRFEAKPMGDGLWAAQLGAFGSGLVSYRIVAEAPAGAGSWTADHAFEVGRRVEVVGLGGVQQCGDALRLTLGTSSATSALLELRFPAPGVCRAELRIKGGEGADVTAGSPSPGPRAGTGGPGLDFGFREEAGRILVEAPGLELSIDRGTLSLDARLPGAPTAAFLGSLRFDWLQQEDGQVPLITSRFHTDPDEWLYGLGERFTQANRNGEAWDVRVYEEYKEQGKRTYLPTPFLLSQRGYGLWLDVDEPSLFDLRGIDARVSVEKLVEPGSVGGARLPLFIFVAERPYDITAAFVRLSGPIAVPPKWAFGPWMSANTWNSQARAEEVMARTQAEDVPATVLVLEAWSDESTFYIFNDAEYQPRPGHEAHRLADFRFGGRWPDPKGFVDACHAAGTRVLLWQIPVSKKLDEPHAQHDLDEAHMLERGFAIREADGSVYRNKGWWFTHAPIVDFSHPDATEWWFAKRRYLFDEIGIDGMKTDGGEHLWGRDLRAFDGRRGLELYNGYADLYVGAYHAFVQQATGGDGITFSRAGYTGAHRFPAHWAGDEDSTWTAYRASVRAGLAAGVGGLSMWSWDLGGFSGEIPSVELYLRSAAMAAFCPIMQFHSEGHGASECRDRTPWNIAERHRDPRALSVYRRFARLRMRLMDHLHAEAKATAALGWPLMRYPALAYPEHHDFLAEDAYAYLLGRDLLVAPVTDRGVGTRPVRLPPGGWVDLWSGAVFEGPATVHAPAPIDRIPVFVRADSERLQDLLAAAAETGTEG